MSESVLVLILSFIFTSATAVGGFILNKRSLLAKANADSGDAAESLSNAARTQIETYQKEFVVPLQKRVDDLTGQLSVVEQDRHEEQIKFMAEIKALQDKVTRLDGQIEFMRGELRRSDSALEFIISVTQDKYPEESSKALRIRRGQI